MPTYVRVPIDVTQQEIVQAAYDYLQGKFPDWIPATGNLDTIMLEAWSQEAAQLRTLASDVPTTIFRWYGANILGIPPVDASPATVQTTWTAINNAGYTIQDGTIVGFRTPQGVLYTFRVAGTYTITAGNTATAAGEVLLSATTPGEDSSNLGGNGQAMELVDPLVWVSSILMTGATSGGVDAESDDDYLDRLVAEARLFSRALIVPEDFETAARSHASVYRALAIDGYNPYNNGLSANQSSAETDATGWQGNANATVASTSAQALDGTKSVQMTANSAADMSIRPTPDTQVPVTPGQTITGFAGFRAATTGRTIRIDLAWYTSGQALISTTTGGTTTDTTSGWTAWGTTGIAPPTAAYVRMICVVVSPANAEVHYVDRASVTVGTQTSWQLGPTAAYNNERTITVATMDADGNANSGGVMTEVQEILEARREVNFGVNVIAPSFTTVDVQFTVKALPDFDPVALEGSAESAVADYLNALAWGLPGDDPREWREVSVVRYLKLVQIVQDVTGVDYLVSLTLRRGSGSYAAADVYINGPAGVAEAGTIAATVT